jgi:hypothetical protein
MLVDLATAIFVAGAVLTAMAYLVFDAMRAPAKARGRKILRLCIMFAALYFVLRVASTWPVLS